MLMPSIINPRIEHGALFVVLSPEIAKDQGSHPDRASYG